MAHLSVIGTRKFLNRDLVFDILDMFYEDDPFITIRSGGTSKVSQWAEEWAIINEADWNTRFEYWHKAEEDEDYWLQCHADLLIETDHAVVFWDGECKDTPKVFDIAREKQVPMTVILSEHNSNTFEIL